MGVAKIVKILLAPTSAAVILVTDWIRTTILVMVCHHSLSH